MCRHLFKFYKFASILKQFNNLFVHSTLIKKQNTYKVALKRKVFTEAMLLSDSLGVSCYVIGGFVRDYLLKRGIAKDVDIVVDGNGIAFARNLAKALGVKNVAVFKNFGTAMFQFRDVTYEFVGARKESYLLNSRNPKVSKGSIEDDQRRRDFTINALALSLNKVDFGVLIDPFNGVDDLKNKCIRTPLEPEITFSDDPLRMLRAIRFASQLQFTIEDDVLQAISKTKERISIISAERIHIELNKIILSEKPSVGFLLLKETGLLAYIFPELNDMSGVKTQGGITHKDNFLHTLSVLDNIAINSNDLWLRWAALLHDIAKPRTQKFVEGIGWTFYGHNFVGEKMVPQVFRRLKLPMNDKMKFVAKLVGLHMRPIALVEDVVTDSAVRRLLFEAGDDIDALMSLCEADITSKNEARVKRFLKNFKIVRTKLKEVEEKDALRNFQPPISGEEIMQAFNLPPCKEVGIIKNAIKEAILEGEIPNHPEEARKFMVKIAKDLNIAPKS
jgi:poly(A) polymerase